MLGDEAVDQRAIPAEVLNVGPGDFGAAVPIGAGQGDHPPLMGDQREWAQQNSLNPTEYGGRCADSHRQAEDGEQREARVAPEHAEAEAEVLGEPLEPEAAPRIPGQLLHQADVAELAAGVGSGLRRRLARGDALGFGHSQMGLDLELEFPVAARPPPRKERIELHDSLSSGALKMPAIASAT